MTREVDVYCVVALARHRIRSGIPAGQAAKLSTPPGLSVLEVERLATVAEAGCAVARAALRAANLRRAAVEEA